MSTMMQQHKIWFGIFKPNDGFAIDDAAAHIVSVVASAERNIKLHTVVLASLNDSWVAVVCKGAWDRIGELLQSQSGGIVREVDSGTFDLISEERRDEESNKELRVGQTVSVRRIYTDAAETQELMAYSCIAVQKAYFNTTAGLRTYAFYTSEACRLIVGLALWDNAESAFAMVDPRGPGSPAEAYWIDLGASKLKFEVCRVIYAHSNSQCRSRTRPQIQDS